MKIALYCFWLAYRSVITIVPHLDIVPSKLHADHRMSALSSNITLSRHFLQPGPYHWEGFPNIQSFSFKEPSVTSFKSQQCESWWVSDNYQTRVWGIYLIQERGGSGCQLFPWVKSQLFLAGQTQTVGGGSGRLKNTWRCQNLPKLRFVQIFVHLDIFLEGISEWYWCTSPINVFT